METLHPSNKLHDKYCHYFPTGKKSHEIYVAKNSFIFGPNASGKSNLLTAMKYMSRKVQYSHDVNKKEDMKPDYFRLNTESKNKSSFFEIIMDIDTEVFQYNFELLWEEVISENLFWIGTDKKSLPRQLLARNRSAIDLFYELNNPNAEDIKEQKTDSTTLFISAAQNWKEPIPQKISAFFRDNLRSIDMMNLGGSYTNKRLQDPDFKSRLLGYIRKWDFSINDLVIEENPFPKELIDKIPELKDKKNIDLRFLHHVYDENGNVANSILFNSGDESEWTKAFLKILWPIIDTIDNWRILLIDEFNASLHPALCEFIIDLTLDKDENQNNAQFIFATHDISILDNKKLNKDQFWFTERDKYGASSLYSLDDFDIRNDDKNYQAKYRNGRFGALPFISK